MKLDQLTTIEIQT